ncbi:MAG: hypothetical protein OXF50_11940 [Caldilineaceae bacterium]|nr:hypothetical protein [Caldilineaceae bacterium]
MKRANVYALLIIVAILLLFCLAVVSANAQETGNDERIVTGLGELIEELLVRVETLDERITTIEDADQQGELWDTANNLDA